MVLTRSVTSVFVIAVVIMFALAMAFMFAPAVFAAGPYDAITSNGNNPTFQDSGLGSIENVNNPALRFGAGGGIATPGQGGQHAHENAAVSPYDKNGSHSLVRPNGAF